MMGTGRIEREILVEAPVDVVWEVITASEHLGHWFKDDAQIELRVDGRGRAGPFTLRVVAVEAPHRFAFRWVRRTGVEPDEDNSTLVEMRLTAENGGTRLRMVETGIADLPWPEAERAKYEDEYRLGWERTFERLEAYLARLDLGSRP